MTVEIGDMVEADGRVGEVVGIDDITGRAVIRPFPQLGQENLEAEPAFTASGAAEVLKKHWEWASAGVRRTDAEWQQWAAGKDRQAQEHAAYVGAADRAWFAQRQEWDR